MAMEAVLRERISAISDLGSQRTTEGEAGPNRFHQNRTVTWHRSKPRSNKRSSTFRSDGGTCSYMSTTSRITSGDELKYRNGLGGLAFDRRLVALRHQRERPAAALD